MADSTSLTERTKKLLQELPREQFSTLRIAGYTLYCTWVLAVFYSTFIYVSSADYRGALFLNLFISLAALTLVLFIISRFIKRADKMMLSKRVILPATITLCLATLILALVDGANLIGQGFIIGSAFLTGISSGVLFLGWGRLFADAGTRVAINETALAWLFAALICLILTFLPPLVSVGITIICGALAGFMLRACALKRPSRPVPHRKHRLKKRTRNMFGRGLFAAINFGFVAGFADVISGFRMFIVSDYYGTFLLLGAGLIALVALIISIVKAQNAVVYVYRFALLVMALGCLSIPFMSHEMTYPNAIILGGYICFMIILLVINIDISNYFDIPATKVIGTAFAALYLGEMIGSGTAHLITLFDTNVVLLDTFAFLLTGAILFANLFLFTEKDLTETHIGELIDSEEEEASPPPDDANNLRTAAICNQLVAAYHLSPRESDVLPLVVKGRTIARIQEELFISAGTVSTHVRHIYQKCGVKNRQELLDLVDTYKNSPDGED